MTLAGLAEQTIETLVHADGRLVRTITDLIRYPGRLTASYAEGRRRPYLNPIQLFFVANLAFFAVQSLTGPQVFGRPLESQLQQQIYSPYARELVTVQVLSRNTTISAYAREFDQSIALHAKSLIILMVPPIACIAAVLFHRRTRRAVAHLVFALHFYSAVLLLQCLLLPVQRLSLTLGTSVAGADAISGATTFVLGAIYLFLAIPSTYGVTGARRLLGVPLLLATFAASWVGYRFAVFLLTLATV